MDYKQLIFIFILIPTLYLLISEKVRSDVVSMLAVVLLNLTNILSFEEAVSGFSSEPVLMVASVFILSAGLYQTGVTETIGRQLVIFSRGSETLTLILMMLIIAVLSAFTHHLMVTALMLPVIMSICKEKKYFPSRFLIPMATSASLGTLLTIIGAPAFLLANSILNKSGYPSLSFFGPAKIGIPIIVLSIIIILLLRKILPVNTNNSDINDQLAITDMTTELEVTVSSKWIDKTLAELKFNLQGRILVVGILRKHIWLSEREEELKLKSGDVLLVQATPEEIASINESNGLIVRSLQKFRSLFDDLKDEGRLGNRSDNFLKAILSPYSKFVGKTLEQIKLLERFGVFVVGVWRRKGNIRDPLAKTVLHAGDLLFIWGQRENLSSLISRRDFLAFLPFDGVLKDRVKANRTIGVLVMSVGLSCSSLVEPVIAFLLGSLLMIILGCINIEKIYDSIEGRVFVMIAGLIPLGVALKNVKLDEWLANYLTTYIGHLSPFVILLIMFWVSSLITQVMSDSATTVLLAPVGIAFSIKNNISPVATVVVITIAAVASFLSPIGHHGNLLIMKPGGYKFVDFLKIGVPLTIVISILSVHLSLKFW